MDWADHANMPEAYANVKWLADTLDACMAIGWTITYISSLFEARRHRTYGVPLLSLCFNAAWEFMFSFMYPAQSWAEHLTILMWLAFNGCMWFGVLKYAKHEFESELAVRSIPYFLVFGTLAGAWFYQALLNELGLKLGVFYAALTTQIMFSVGAIGQLVTRQSTRGQSWTMWLGRALGSDAALVLFGIRLLYWPEEFQHVNGAMAWWGASMQVILDGVYAVLFWIIRKKENESGGVRGKDGRTLENRRVQ